jgi:molybdopterin-containing oxidoreductase family membrane subunit
MVLLIGSALIIMLVTLLTPSALHNLAILQPRFSLGAGVVAAGLILFLTDPRYASVGLSSDVIDVRAFAWAWVVLLLLIVALGIAVWFKRHPITAAVIAGFAVIMGTWLERWNIVVPTVTHPRNIAYSVYHPTLTEIGLTVASVALLVLLFVVFYKLFPPVSLWEIEEGRVVESAEEQVSIPTPEPSATSQRKRRWVFRQSSSISSRRS